MERGKATLAAIEREVARVNELAKHPARRARDDLYDRVRLVRVVAGPARAVGFGSPRSALEPFEVAVAVERDDAVPPVHRTSSR